MTGVSGFMASPGWVEAYAKSQNTYDSADEPKPPHPGVDESAITDVMIRDAVRTVLQSEAVEPELA